MLTADTITDEQIRELRNVALGHGYDQNHATGMQCWIALALTDPNIHHVQRYAARARCAEILNARPAPNDVADERKR